jgi:hypothetical protein
LGEGRLHRRRLRRVIPAKESVKKSNSRTFVMAELRPAPTRPSRNIEMFSFFLDGRVKHGHDEERFLPRFLFFHTLEGGKL